MELISLTHLKEVLDEYAAQAAEIYKYQIALGAHNASRELVDNVKAQVNVDGTAWEVSLSLKEYWKYLEGGSKGTESSPVGAVYPPHMPPAWAILKWIQVKPVIPRPLMNLTPRSMSLLAASRKPRIPTPEQLSYMIAESIEKRGIEPYPALQTTIDELNAMYKDKFVIALSKDVGVYINKVLHPLSQGRMMQPL